MHVSFFLSHGQILCRPTFTCIFHCAPVKLYYFLVWLTNFWNECHAFCCVWCNQIFKYLRLLLSVNVRVIFFLESDVSILIEFCQKHMGFESEHSSFIFYVMEEIKCLCRYICYILKNVSWLECMICFCWCLIVTETVGRGLLLAWKTFLNTHSDIHTCTCIRVYVCTFWYGKY
jgi:hypothetical protein